jgi:hypothetical protein
MPIAFAVLMTSSNSVGSSIGKSAGADEVIE